MLTRPVLKSRNEVMKNLYVRLVVAGRTGKGIRLSAEDCEALAGDDPIVTAAQVVAEDAGFDINTQGRVVPLSK